MATRPEYKFFCNHLSSKLPLLVSSTAITDPPSPYCVPDLCKECSLDNKRNQINLVHQAYSPKIEEMELQYEAEFRNRGHAYMQPLQEKIRKTKEKRVVELAKIEAKFEAVWGEKDA